MNPFTDAPRAFTKAINRFGGLNPYGKPMWRVCIAEHVICKRGGIFYTWPEGKKEQITLGKDYEAEFHNIRPEKIEHGILETPRWPVKGWIAERWMPAHYWGSREWWEAQKATDGITPLLGPYPEEGDYWMLMGPWPKIPDLGDLEQAIGMYEMQQRNKPRNLELEIRRRVREQEDREIAEYENLVAALEQFRKSEIMPVLQSTSLNAQAVRNEVQKSLGLKSHQGVI